VTTWNLKNPGELVGRMELDRPERLLLIDVPAPVTDLVKRARALPLETRETTGDAIRAVKETFDAVLVWREDRAGSRAVFDGALKRLADNGVVWAVTAMRKVRGPTTPAVHRLELSDLVKGLGKAGLAHDREVRVSAWHVAYRFGRPAARAR
jgi:hypothetical protein